MTSFAHVLPCPFTLLHLLPTSLMLAASAVLVPTLYGNRGTRLHGNLTPPLATLHG